MARQMTGDFSIGDRKMCNFGEEGKSRQFTNLDLDVRSLRLG